MVERDHPQTGVNLTYISQTGSTGDAGDQYTGLDRFGRVVEQNWYDTTTSASVDDYQYGYDADGDVLYKENMIDAALSQLFGYNNLQELTSFEQGTLNSDKTGLTGSSTAQPELEPRRAGELHQLDDERHDADGDGQPAEPDTRRFRTRERRATTATAT